MLYISGTPRSRSYRADSTYGKHFLSIWAVRSLFYHNLLSMCWYEFRFHLQKSNKTDFTSYIQKCQIGGSNQPVHSTRWRLGTTKWKILRVSTWLIEYMMLFVINPEYLQRLPRTENKQTGNWRRHRWLVVERQRKDGGPFREIFLNLWYEPNPLHSYTSYLFLVIIGVFIYVIVGIKNNFDIY